MLDSKDNRMSSPALVGWDSNPLIMVTEFLYQSVDSLAIHERLVTQGEHNPLDSTVSQVQSGYYRCAHPLLVIWIYHQLNRFGGYSLYHVFSLIPHHHNGLVHCRTRVIVT